MHLRWPDNPSLPMPLKRHRSNRLICGIDGAPFTITMLVVVFVLLTVDLAPPTVCGGTSVDLPRVGHPISMAKARRWDAIEIYVTRDGKVIFGTDFVRPSELPSRIQTSISQGSERKVYIRSDARAKYGWVKGVLNEVQASGVERIGFLVYQRKTASESTQSLQ